MRRFRGAWWTPEYLAFVLDLTPDQVLASALGGPYVTPESREEWRWIQTAQRLTWQYGPEAAVERLNGYAVAGAL